MSAKERVLQLALGEPWMQSFHDLMPFRVRNILLVSSAYDAFVLEEDGRLSERLFLEYSELNLHWAPRIRQVTTAKGALELLEKRRFDLVLSTVRLQGPTMPEFCQELRKRYPNLPLGILTFNERDLRRLSWVSSLGGPTRVFFWTGDTRILLAMIKQFEDTLNVASDTEAAGVQVILVVEDSVRRYSTFLALLYTELMTQSQSLIAEGVNALHKLMRMRTRPKVLLATSFEEATRYFRLYQDNVFGVISDVRFPRDGKRHPTAGFELVEFIRGENPNMPILLQSADAENVARARELNVHFADKNSPRLLRRIRGFLKETLGFGDFIFRLPSGAKVARARDMFEMERVLADVPAESLYYHASNNHINVWLRARSMFQLAGRIRSIQATDFATVEELRHFLIRVLHRAAERERTGVIADFSARMAGHQNLFLRLGGGSIGGKGRGIAFIHSVLARKELQDKFLPLQIKIPQTVAIGTDEFDEFVEHASLAESQSGNMKDVSLFPRFLDARLPPRVALELRKVAQEIRRPLAIRSSSLLEDSQQQSCAGVYSTYMLPNNHPDREVRFAELCRAIQAVYASTFAESARAYMAKTPFWVEEEKMAVVIQELVGQFHGQRFYPHMSGVALSYNFYPAGKQKAEDGIVMLALGLGAHIVRGGDVLRFSPKMPQILPQYRSTKEILEYSQSEFYALDVSNPRVDFLAGSESSLRRYPLAQAEADGVLGSLACVYSPDDDVLRDSFALPGPRVLNFRNILRWSDIPLAEALDELLSLFRRAMGCPVEIEFAVDLGDWDRKEIAKEKGRKPCLHLLQIRPLIEADHTIPLEVESFSPDAILAASSKALGHGLIEDIFDLVYVVRDNLEAPEMPAIIAELHEMNAKLLEEGRGYILLGAGRWGSSDPSLGIPVDWPQISGARVIVETPFHHRALEPSQGSHFFHNLMSLDVGYLCVGTYSGVSPAQGSETLDRQWLQRQSALHDGREVRHLRFDQPLVVILDGTRSRGTILKSEVAASVIGQGLLPTIPSSK